MPRSLIVCALFLSLWPARLASQPLSGTERSLFFGIDFGVSFDLSEDARRPPDLYRRDTEAYAADAFGIGFGGGYRFSERWALEGGWHSQEHSAHPEWGGQARYSTGHLQARLAFPLATRQTPVLGLGAVAGSFSYGVASFGGYEDNETPLVGGLVSVTLEHELALGVVAVARVSYAPAYRFGMHDRLVVWYDAEGDGFFDEGEDSIVDEKDFTGGDVVHLMWLGFGIQFEWTLR